MPSFSDSKSSSLDGRKNWEIYELRQHFVLTTQAPRCLKMVAW